MTVTVRLLPSNATGTRTHNNSPATTFQPGLLPVCQRSLSPEHSRSMSSPLTASLLLVKCTCPLTEAW